MATLEETVPYDGTARPDGESGTVHDSKSDDMKCSICRENYHGTPRSLPCGHTFCEACLQTYITDKGEKGELKDNTFECFACRQPISPPCRDEQISNWATHFPSTDVEVKECKKKLAKLDDKKKRYCDSCTMDAIVEDASKFCVDCNEHLCKECLRYHKKCKATKAHRVVELDENVISVEQNITDTCKVHAGKHLEYYCRDDEVLCCSDCAINAHSRCHGVKEIHHFCSNFRKSNEVEEIKKTMGNIETYFQKLVEEMETNLKHLQNQVNDIPNTVKKMKESINDKLDSLERSLTTSGKMVFEEQKETVHQVSELCHSRIAEVKNSITALKTIDQFGSDYQYFVAVKMLRSRAREYEQFAAGIELTMTNVLVEPKFDESVNSASSKEQLGQLERTDQSIDIPIWPLDGLTNCCPVTQSGVGNVLLPPTYRDRFRPAECSSGVCLQDGRKIIVADNNDALLLDDCLYYQSNISEVCRKYCFEYIGLVYVAPDVILWLSSEYTTEFQRMQVKQNALQLSTERTSVGNVSVCLGVLEENTFLLARKYKNEVEFVTSNETGDVKRVLFRPEMGGNTLNEYLNVSLSANKNRLLYSSLKHQSLYCYSFSGILLFTYQHKLLQDPAGVAVDKYDNIYLCGKTSDNIHQLTPGGQLITIIKCETLKLPTYIFFSCSGKEFYVLHEKKDYRHQIHRFSLCL